jgi:hypothetical protein
VKEIGVLTPAFEHPDGTLCMALGVHAPALVRFQPPADAHAIIEGLKLRIAKARQDKWGQSSERHKQLLDQLEMQLEDVVTAATEDELAAEMVVAKATAAGAPVGPFTRKKAAREPLPADLPAAGCRARARGMPMLSQRRSAQDRRDDHRKPGCHSAPVDRRANGAREIPLQGL